MDTRMHAGGSPARPRPGRRPAILFAEDFDAPAGITVLDDTAEDAPPPEPPAPPAITAEDVAAARAEAYAEGHCAGLSQAAADRAEITRQMLGIIAERLTSAREDA